MWKGNKTNAFIKPTVLVLVENLSIKTLTRNYNRISLIREFNFRSDPWSSNKINANEIDQQKLLFFKGIFLLFYAFVFLNFIASKSEASAGNLSSTIPAVQFESKQCSYTGIFYFELRAVFPDALHTIKLLPEGLVPSGKAKDRRTRGQNSQNKF